MEPVTKKWLVDILMGVSFVVCFVTGLVKDRMFMGLTGLSGLILPYGLISDLHDWSGILMGFFVLVHLVLNRRWILAVTKKVFSLEER